MSCGTSRTALATGCGTILLLVHEQHRAEKRGREDRHQVQHLDCMGEMRCHRRLWRRLREAPSLHAALKRPQLCPGALEHRGPAVRRREGASSRGWPALPLPGRRVWALLAHPEKL